MTVTAIARFAALVAFGFYLPGRLLTPRRLEGAEGLAAAVALGMTVAAVLWIAALLLGAAPQASFLVLAALAAMSAVRGLGRIEVRGRLTLGAAACGALFSVAWTQFGNGLGGKGEPLAFQSSYASEALYHCAIAQELRHSFPMHVPAGTTLHYHVAYNVIAALTAEATGASMLDVNYRLLPALLVPLTVISGAGFAEIWGVSPRAAAAAGFGLFVFSDLSWIFGLAGLTNPAEHFSAAWELLLGVPLLYALHHNRGFLAGAAVSLVTLSAALRYLRSGGCRELGLAAVLGAALFAIKISFWLPLAAAVVVTAFAAAACKERLLAQRAGRLGVALLLLSLPLLWSLLPVARQISAPAFSFLPGFAATLPLIRLGFFRDFAEVGRSLREAPLRFALFWGLPSLGLFTLGTLGVRLLGVAEVLRRARERGPEMLCAGIVAVGYGTTIMLVTGAARENIIYFWGAALVPLGVLAGVALARKPAPRRVMWLAGAAVLALPGTAQLLWAERSFAAAPVLEIPAGVTTAASYLVSHARPGDVILEPEIYRATLPALLPLRFVVAWPEWQRWVHGKQLVYQRAAEVRRFFGTADEDERRNLLERYGVRWVWSPPTLDLSGSPGLKLALETADGNLWEVNRQ